MLKRRVGLVLAGLLPGIALADVYASEHRPGMPGRVGREHRLVAQRQRETRSDRRAGPVRAPARARHVPIALHPGNPHYFLFRDRPAVLVTSAEHYGAVINLDFDYRTYLKTLHADGLNLTRVFTGAYREPYWGPGTQNTLAPRPNRLLAPWARSGTPGYRDGGAEFGLDRWDPAYFNRLRDFVSLASRYGIVVEVVFFSKMYDDHNWVLSPLHAGNNVNGIGKGPWQQFSSLDDRALVARQEALIRKVTSELRGFDNVYYELCNEPDIRDRMDKIRAWLNHLADVTAAAEASYPRRHLIAVQDPTMCDSSVVSVYNFHYSYLDLKVGTMGAMQGLERFYNLNKPLIFDETETDRPDRVSRREAWAFLLSGGAGYNYLDTSFMTDDATGSGKAEWDGKRHDYRALRRQLGFLKRFMEGMEFLRMRPSREEVVRAVPAGVESYALAEPGRGYALYLCGKDGREKPGAGALVLNVPTGRYRVEWLDPETCRRRQLTDAVSTNGALTLAVPTFTFDLALRLERERGGTQRAAAPLQP
jgi:hypothetical protein